MIIRRQLIFAISGVFLLSVALLSALAVPQLERTVLERTNRLMLTEATRAAENIDHRLLSRGLILQNHCSNPFTGDLRIFSGIHRLTWPED